MILVYVHTYRYMKMAKVAVYGSLRKGMGNHSLLSNSTQLGKCVVNIPYKMVDLGAFPALVGAENRDIVIEVYEVTDTTMNSLDRLEGYHGPEKVGNLYERTYIATPYGEAYLYVMEDTEWAYGSPEVRSGDWVQHCVARAI